MSTSDTWNPDKYQAFAAERAQPFHDLLSWVRPAPGASAVDLGCGTGELTLALHQHLGAATTLGVDLSPAMLERAKAVQAPGLTFAQADLGQWAPPAPLDVVFSNAALHWVEDH